MKFKLLNNEFNNLLTEYNTTYKEYIDLLNNQTNNSEPITKYISLKNKVYLGNTISHLDINTLSDCKKACLDNPLCGGANFSSIHSDCELIKDNGNIITSIDHTAIIPNKKYYSYKLEELNNKLIELNKKMQLSESKEQEEIKTNNDKTKENKILLEQNYKELLQERKQIQQMMKEFETINSVYINNNLLVNMNYWWYVLLLFIFIIFIILFIRLIRVDIKQLGGINRNIIGNYYKKNI